jgi:hypothetical protein
MPNEEVRQSRARAAPARKRLPTTLRILLLLTLFLVAVFIAADTTGHNLAGSDPDGALLLAPWEPAALDELAQRQLASPGTDLKPVEDLARRALLSIHLDLRALSLLGMVAERKGDLVRAETLMSLSAARSWRNPEPHVWLFDKQFAAANLRKRSCTPMGCCAFIQALRQRHSQFRQRLS